MSATGYSSVDDFPPLTDAQCMHVASLLSLAPKPATVTT